MDPSALDPVDWGIEDVVSFLCHAESRPWAEGSNIPFPPPADLAAALHENFITGEVLLEEIDRATLKDELGVKPLGHRSGVMKAIVWLRNRSAKYQAKYRTKYEGKFEAGSGSPSINGLSSPNIGLSTQIPSLSSGLGISAQETSLPKAPERNHVPSIAPKGKRRIAPQLIQPLKGDPALYESLYPSPQQTSSNNALVPGNNSSGSQSTLARTGTNLEKQPHSAYLQQESQLGIDGPERERQNEKTANSSPSNLSSSPTEDDFYQSLLQRYPPDEGDTDGLPLYGDSGSEGEYDEQTWEEMQLEAEEHQQPSNQLAPTEKQSLSSEECMSLIAQHIIEKESRWKDKHLPRELPKASGIWEHSHAHGTLGQDKKRLTRRIALYQKRLEKLKGGLLQVEFTDRAFFLQSCASLDPTITDLCLDKWTLGILNLDTQPPRVEKPPKVSRPKPERSNFRDDESLRSATETDSEDDDAAFDSIEDTSEADESEFMEIDSDKLTTQTQAEKPRNGLPFTLDSPTPEEDEATLTEPSRKRRRIYDELSDDETSSETGLISEFLRRGDIDTVDLTGNSPNSTTAPAPSANVNSSIPVRQESMQNIGEDADEMQIETPPLNPTHSVAPQDNDVEELSVDSPPQSSLPKVKLRLHGPHPPGIRTQNSRQTQPEDRVYSRRLSDISVDALPVADEHDVELFDQVKTMDIEAIALSKNRVQLLAKLILGLRQNEPNMIRKYLDDYFLSQISDLVHEALIAMCHDRMKLPDRDENENTGAMRLAALYHSWHHCIVLSSRGLDKQLLRTTISQIEKNEFESMFKSFIDRLSKLFTAYNTWIDKHPDHSPHFQKGSLDMSVAMSRSSSSSQTKKKTKFAPRAPSSIQREAQIRQEKQEAMRQEREKRGLTNSDPDKQAVTFKEPVIYLPREIGEHVKPHQLAGIQFMWRELIEAKKPQGCLLAHVMGLGKTMQV